MTPEIKDLGQSGAAAAKPADRGSYWEFLAIPIRGYRIVLLCGVLWCGFQTARTYLAVPTYTSSAIFRPLQTSNVPSALAQLAALAGLVSRSPSSVNYGTEFYLYLMTSRQVLDEIVSKTYVLSDGSKATLPDLFNVSGDDEDRRTRTTRRRVRRSIRATRMSEAGLVRLDVTTRWPEVSYAIAKGLMEEVNSFRSAISQGAAQEEKAFISNQLVQIHAEVVAWEDSLQAFLAGNRVIMDHSELSFTLNRIRAELDQRRALHTDLTRVYMEARINEVRETPSLLVTSHPRLPRLPARADFDPRTLVPPLVAGLFAGMVLAVAWEWVRRNWDYDNPTVVAVREAWPRLTSVAILRTWFWPQADHDS